jgi:hypothetical protein
MRTIACLTLGSRYLRVISIWQKYFAVLKCRVGKQCLISYPISKISIVHNYYQNVTVDFVFVCLSFVCFRHTLQFLLVEERTQIHYTMYLERDHRHSKSKLTNFLTQTNHSNRRGLEVRGLLVWDRRLNHSATEALSLVLSVNTRSMHTHNWSYINHLLELDH